MDTNQHNPIFYDPKKKRWPRIKNSFLVIVFLLFILFFAFLVSIYLTPALNSLPLSPVNRLSAIKYHSLQNVSSSYTQSIINKQDNSIKRIFSDIVMNKSKFQPPLVIGFLVNYDEDSYISMVDNLDKIDIVTGEFLHLNSAKGDIVEDDPEKQKIVTNTIYNHDPEKKIIPLINNIKNEKWEAQTIAELLSSRENQQNLIQQLLNYVSDHHYAGINIDFENVPEKSRDHLTAFMYQLSRSFHQKNLTVSIDVIGNDPAYDLSALAKMVDYVVLMAYDEHWAEGNPGPIASLDWFANTLNHVLTEVPVTKLVIGLGNYGYDWKLNKHQADEISFQDLMLITDLASSKVVFDPTSLNATFSYLENGTVPHVVWFLDAVSLFNQLAVSQKLYPYGYSIWRLGSEDPSIWKLIGHPVSGKDVSQLEEIAPGYTLNYEGKGEIIRVIKEPQNGSRKMMYDNQRKLITDERYLSYPTSYVLNRYGATNEKQLALTFDDGPDPVYTPKILDILKETHTHATFFVIGANALMNPEILTRELDEGHDIGNHTFTHPNISEISVHQLQIEVTSTEKLLESYLGRGSLLFRPPYAEDAEPETIDRVKGIYGLSQLGYLIVGMNIDPNDWQQPGIENIIQSVLTQVSQNAGNIILLHDAGGNREQTVAALPVIISELKQRGYELVTLSELLGTSQAETMPDIEEDSPIETFVSELTFKIMLYGSKTIKILFFIGIFLGIIKVIMVSILAVYQKLKDRSISHSPRSNYSVAVVIPAYNEEKVIKNTIDSLLNALHPTLFEIIVVDDGSTDKTLQILQNNYSQNPIIKIISQTNSGKAAALNNAIAHTQSDVIVTLDADTVFTRKTIMELICVFDDPTIGAVAGNIKVGNRINLITRMQALEYITSQNMERRAFKVLDTITVVPGCVGAWRRDLIVNAGGFSNDTLAEDTDLTVKIRKQGYHIVIAEKAIAYTEAPHTIKAFLKQRYRWMYGTFQVGWKHLDVLLRPRYGYLAFVGMPSLFIYQILFPLIAPLMDLLLVLSVLSAILNGIYHPLGFHPDTLIAILTYYVLFTLVDFVTGLIGFILENKENKKLLWLLIPQRFFYRQLIYYVAIKTIISSLRGTIVGWDKLIRTATVGKQESQ